MSGPPIVGSLVCYNLKLALCKKQEARNKRTIKWLENNWNNFSEDYLTMDQIAVGCALDYAVFRYNEDWKLENKRLHEWFDKFVEKDFMKSTIPKKN